MKALKILKITFAIFFVLQIASTIFLAASFQPVLAEENPIPLNFTPQVKIPKSDLDQNTIPVGEYLPDKGVMRSDLLVKYVKAFYGYGLSIAGILAAIVLMAGGILWLTSAGNDSRISQAKELIIGSVTGLVILFCSWIILNTINPDLVKLRPIETQVIDKLKYGDCCQYSDFTAKDGITKKACEKDSGKYYEKSKAVQNTSGKGFCADSGCCKCKVGGSWTTFWTSLSECADSKKNSYKITPDMCELACQSASDAMGISSWEILFSWGQYCNEDDECVWGTGGAGSSW